MSNFIINVPFKIMKQVDVGAYFGRLLALIMAVLLCIRVLKRHARKCQSKGWQAFVAL